MYHHFADLLTAYLATLKGRTKTNSVLVAKQWLLTVGTTPTRTEIVARHKAKGHGHYQPGASQANTELALMRAACRWGIYQECWHGGDPTVGVKKFRTGMRKRTIKFEEIKTLLTYFERASTEREIQDRALFGIMLFIGCRPGEARTMLITSVTPYGTMGCWNKGKTKNGEDFEVPLPAQILPWIEAWKAILPRVRPNPYLFPGQKCNQPVTIDCVEQHWHDLRLRLGLHGLWNYDLRRSFVSYMENTLKYPREHVKAIIGHIDRSAYGHYNVVPFDTMTGPIQHYADWLCGLKQPVKVATPSQFSAIAQEVRA